MPDAPQDRIPAGEAPARMPKVPTTRAPLGACDAHVHMLSGPEHALSGTHAESPAEIGGYEEWLTLFRLHLDTLGCTRAVIVQSILYGTDNTVTLETVERLGDMARGIVLVTGDVSDGTLDDLARRGAKGIRINYVHGGVLDWPGAKALAPRLAARGMHVQMLLHADRHMEEVAEDARALPCPLVIDHAGWPSDLGPGPRSPGFAALCDALKDGNVWAKLSAPYRLSPDWDDTDPFVRALVAANPERCLWGSDWPHIMLGGATMPDAGRLLDRFMEQVPDPGDRQRILVDNPARLYGF
ncbi:putative TIM-barrel fold metal-dependent hydrolase [Hasllibacter halocynthiae]|uniref:Putative TIM-barrel fold metal-dependent hydrolase n=1 Tax=Hasllibacter halocynthiae TaxID=595589 RepID=A0A2T0X733_9RHOB|nr:amidohydrolase family protein [Hasllibacter halocynthiae]PRY94746.1 putative TIM-barrel fold metal-dependent hydrolase [Hasllibacter halocynthiae]